MIYRRGKVYWYEFVFNGRRYRGTTDIPIGRGVPGDTPPKEKAKQVENAKRHKLALEAAGIPQPDPPPVFSDFAARFLNHIRAEKKQKPKTVAFYTTEVGLLRKFSKFDSSRLDEIQGETVSEYI